MEQGAAIAAEVGPEIGVMADFFHMGIEEVDIAASIRANRQHLVYVHVADSNRLQPGRGHLDFRPGFRALKEIGYDGPLAIECRVDGPYDEAIREAVALIRGSGTPRNEGCLKLKSVSRDGMRYAAVVLGESRARRGIALFAVFVLDALELR